MIIENYYAVKRAGEVLKNKSLLVKIFASLFAVAAEYEII